MQTLFWKRITQLLVFCIVVQICATAVSDTACDPDNTDATTGGAAVCTAVDPNAECPDSATACACKSGYKDGPQNSNTCVLIPVSETTCDPDSTDATTGGTAVCTAVDPNAECPAGTTKCACKSEYKEGSPDTNTCVVIPVSETTCDPDNTDATTGGTAVCTALDPNAECPAGTTKCACKSGYKEGSPDSNTCVVIPVSDTACDPDSIDATTGGAAVCTALDPNAECPAGATVCACKSGYQDGFSDSNTCVLIPDKSSATSAWMTASMVRTSLLICVLKHIF